MRVQSLCRLLLVALFATHTGCAYATLGRVTKGGREVRRVDARQVRVSRAGEPVETSAGMKLEQGDVVETGPGATAVLRFQRGAYAVMQPESRITVSSIFQWFGEVFLSGIFRAETEDTDFAAEGTGFVLEVRDGRETLSVLSGRVRVSSRTGRFESLLVGAEQRVVIRDRVASRPRRLSGDELDAIVKRINAATEPSDRLVPGMVGMSEREALDELRRFGLRVGEREDVPARPERVGRVVDQNPQPGSSALGGGRVDLRIGAEGTVVPRVEGMARAAAEERILKERLRIGRVRTELTGKVAEGHVTRQQPRAGNEVLIGEAVDLWVEAPSTLVPDLVDFSRRAAEQRLRAADLSVGRVTTELHANVRDGQVLRQSPRAGERLAPGGRVDLVVAREGVVVPYVAGRTRADASVLLRRAGLSTRMVQESSDQVSYGTVIRTEPTGGSLVERATEVRVVVSSGGRIR